MKKKRRTYILLVAVIAIWGILGFRIVRTVSPPDVAIPAFESASEFQIQTPKARDTFSILANYRDPFLGTKPRSTHKRINKSTKPKNPAVPEKVITYSGWVNDKASSQKIFFLNVEGQQLMLTRNQEVQGIKLLSGDAQKVRIRCNSHTKTILRAQ